MRKKLAAAIIALAMTGAIAGGTIYSYAENNDAKLSIAGEEQTTEAAPADSSDEDAQPNYSNIAVTSLDDVDSSSETFSYSNVADVTEAVMPSIVSITNQSVQEVQDWFSRQSYEYTSESAGSGIIIGSNDEELLIATNNHVVEDASTLTVTFIDEESYEAQVKGTDPSNDLAVVAVKLADISSDTMDQIKISKLGDSESLRVGEQVVAIGNALGYGQSVTTGIVSALDRTIEVGSDSEQGMMQSESDVSAYENLIQTDAAINPGNSGGALLDMNGEVIGINSAKASASGVEGMGYAIPVSKALPILQELMAKETRTKVDADQVGYMGIAGDGVSSEAVKYYNVPAGVYVTEVGTGTPAEKAGLMESDIITKFDGTSVSSMSELQEQLQYYAAGEEVELTVQTKKDGAYTEETLTITLGSKADFQ